MPIGAFVRGERMHVGEARPRQRLHLDCGIQLHRARPQWDHRAIKSEILVGEAAEIAEHLVLGVIPREDRLCQELVGAPTGQAFGLGVVELGGDVERGEQRRHRRRRRCLVETEADRHVVDQPKVEAGRGSSSKHRIALQCTCNVSNQVSFTSVSSADRRPTAAIDVSR